MMSSGTFVITTLICDLATVFIVIVKKLVLCTRPYSSCAYKGVAYLTGLVFVRQVGTCGTIGIGGG